MTPELGIIEGYFGRPWDWAARADVVATLAPAGYRFFLHAPKADAFLRRRWREPHPDVEMEAIAAFAGICRERGVRFGIGLSPYEAYIDFDSATRDALAAKLGWLDSLGLDDLAILFDDMRGDLPDLAERQAAIVDFAAGRTRASRLIVCPSYYSDDPVLDRVFGQRPAGYLESLGRLLDPTIGLFWTGEEVCSREYSAGHLARVAETLRRKPVLWDNYPVNDGPRMSQYLHLRAMTGRPAAIGAHLTAHAINPALQPVLSCIPALTLAMSYTRGADYSYGGAFLEAAQQVVGDDLALMLQADLLSFQDVGLDRLEARRERLRDRYAAVEHPAAREVVDWLAGGYAITGEAVQTQ